MTTLSIRLPEDMAEEEARQRVVAAQALGEASQALKRLDELGAMGL